MAHKQQNDYVNKIKSKFPNSFKNNKVLGIGTFNVVGTEDQYFDECDYQGLDLLPGEGVDIVCPAQEYNAPDNTFDTIISCECFEHNPYYKETMINAYRMLKSGGLMLLTMATTGRPEHGTARLEIESKRKFPNWKTMPNVAKENWDNNYYRNVTEADILRIMDIKSLFINFEFEINEEHSDLYFWGIKK
jgi:SAM-dependent methyltransferase|tara:strand:- start:937 stop:1506 length:570 start_codon:yes stop_codon:yes gene_type:complete